MPFQTDPRDIQEKCCWFFATFEWIVFYAFIFLTQQPSNAHISCNKINYTQLRAFDRAVSFRGNYSLKSLNGEHGYKHEPGNYAKWQRKKQIQ